MDKVRKPSNSVTYFHALKQFLHALVKRYVFLTPLAHAVLTITRE
jgi:hypothetical protein